MLRTARIIGSILPIGVGLAVAWTGCAQVFDIQDWQEGGAGGRGGDGSQQSSAASSSPTSSSGSGSGAQVSAVTATVGPSATVGSGGQGGQGDTCDGTCAPPPPSGWLGYVVVDVVDRNTQLPPCGMDIGWPSPTDYLTGNLVAPPAMCGSCNCSAPMGGHCNLTQVNIGTYADQNCTTASYSTSVSFPGCVQLPSGMLTSLRAKLTGQSLPSQSSCTPLGMPAEIEPAYFDKRARMCGDPIVSTGCSNGRLCLPQTPPAFPSLCIYKQVADNAQIDCPANYDPAPDFYKDILDTRNCTACTCGLPFAQNCEMSAQVFPNTSCNTGGIPVTTYPGMCSAPLMTANGAASALVVPGTPQGGSCNPSTPNPTGSANGTGRTLVCCLP